MISEEFEESGLLEKFRAVVYDLNVDDAELKCFLRARENDIKQAERMIRQSWAWREEHSFKEAWTWEVPEQLKEAFPMDFNGFDKQGQLVAYLPIGLWKISKMINEGWKNEMERYTYQSMSKLSKLRTESGQTRFVAVLDIAGLSYWQVTHFESLQMFVQMIRDFELNFPDKLSNVIVINAPWVLSLVLPVIRPIIPVKTWEKIQIFDADHSKYLPFILDLIPEKTMPSGLLQVVEKHLKQ